MRVIAVPYRLRLASWAVLVVVPLVALEWFVVSKAPLGKMSLVPLLSVCGILTLLLSVSALGLSRANRTMTVLVLSVILGWSLANTTLAISLGLPRLGFFTILEVVSLGSWVLWLRHETLRSFFDPQLKWYQGAPKPIPLLNCQLDVDGAPMDFSVTRFDQDGAFVYLDPKRVSKSEMPRLKKDHVFEMSFKFRDQEIQCKAKPMRLLVDRGHGAGFQFDGVSADLMKRLGDFVESLRGEGYV